MASATKRRWKPSTMPAVMLARIALRAVCVRASSSSGCGSHNGAGRGHWIRWAKPLGGGRAGHEPQALPKAGCHNRAGGPPDPCAPHHPFSGPGSRSSRGEGWEVATIARCRSSSRSFAAARETSPPIFATENQHFFSCSMHVSGKGRRQCLPPMSGHCLFTLPLPEGTAQVLGGPVTPQLLGGHSGAVLGVLGTARSFAMLLQCRGDRAWALCKLNLGAPRHPRALLLPTPAASLGHYAKSCALSPRLKGNVGKPLGCLSKAPSPCHADSIPGLCTHGVLQPLLPTRVSKQHGKQATLHHPLDRPLTLPAALHGDVARGPRHPQ